MAKRVTTLQNIVKTPQEAPTITLLQSLALASAAIAIICSALAFWPFHHSKLWQMLCPTNLIALVWTLILAAGLVRKSTRKEILHFLPDLSVLAYLTIIILSTAFAADVTRAGSFVVKLILMLLGGHALLTCATYNRTTFQIVLRLITATAILCVSCCILKRFVFADGRFGFYNSPYKYGTYAATIASLSAAYLFTSPRLAAKLFAALLISATLLSAGSLGTVAAVVTAMLAAIAVLNRWPARLCIAGSLITATTVAVLLSTNPNILQLHRDIVLADKDAVNLKQRYIEWQAEINLLERRAIAGTGAGCINDYRSTFYHRLPKLNTLKPFDQNGLLATCAETGILGLVSFCWIVLHYGKLAFLSVKESAKNPTHPAHRFAVAGFVGFVAVCTANLFSSLHYNGVLIVFVLVIVVISKTHQLFFQGAMKCQQPKS